MQIFIFQRTHVTNGAFAKSIRVLVDHMSVYIWTRINEINYQNMIDYCENKEKEKHIDVNQCHGQRNDDELR